MFRPPPARHKRKVFMSAIEIFDLGSPRRLFRIRLAPSRAPARLPVSACPFFAKQKRPSRKKENNTLGANPTQALALIVFIAAFVILAASMAAGGSLTLILISMALLALSGAAFRRAKPWEEGN